MVHLIYRKNAAGLERDGNIIYDELASQGRSVLSFDDRYDEPPEAPSDLTIFVEHLDPRFFSPKKNIFFVNPEWVQDKWYHRLAHLDAICCKTLDAKRIFRHTGKAVFTSFTSHDRLIPGVDKERRMLHSCNRSNQKGTESAIEAYRTARTNIPLTVTNNKLEGLDSDIKGMELNDRRIPEEDYKHMQNRHGLHLCPSNYEGFGHYINEALSTGATLISTQAPPMNELIPKESLVPIGYSEVRKRKLASTYVPYPKDIREAIEHVEKGSENFNEASREAFIKRDRFFRERFNELVTDLL